MQRLAFVLEMLAVVLVLSFIVWHDAKAQQMPDPKLTPGLATNEPLKKVCTRGEAKDERSVSEAEKKQVYARYGIAKCAGYCAGRQGCEIDHLISLELGGSNDITNLWPQPYDGEWSAHHKDQLENKLHELVCSSKITLKEAQQDISSDWVSAYKRYINPATKPLSGPARCTQ
jgi:hypothetical protein